mmetsp:Transcript_35364/g.46558  ORF Transcript_35364/g.46558 Transcript_35364/m.46558 type:complete len:92 (+) Transcript_35364:1056-1331(+)
MNENQRKIAERESSLCQFVYAYLMHNLSYVQMKPNELIDVYRQSMLFVELLKWTRQPNTTCWLIEILHILSNKFAAPQSMSKSGLQEKLER